jgi:ribosome-binding factor A
MASRRQERLAERVKEEVSRLILFDLQDPRMGFVTVMKVKLSSDLVQAKVYVSIMGDEADRNRTLAALSHATGYLQAQVSKGLGIRRSPTLSFALDDTVQRGIRISSLIEQVKREHSPGEKP